jgi:hypothetical protein
MGFQTSALDSGDYTTLRSNHSDRWLVIPNPNTVVFKCRVNQSTFGESFASFTYDTVTVGSYTAALVGFTVYVSHTDDIRASFFKGRVRLAPTSNTLYINQTSLAVADNDYVFVVKDTALHEKMPGYIAGTLYFDFDVAFRQLLPIVRGIPYVVYKRLSGGVADFAFTPDVLYATSGASASTYAWSADGGTFQSGTSSSLNVTLRYTSAGVYRPRFTATDNGGRAGWFSPVVIVNDDTNSIVARNILSTRVQGTVNNGWTSSIECRAGSDLVNILDETEIYIISEETYGDAAGSLLSNVRFVGRLRDEQDSIRVSLQSGKQRSASFEVDGLVAQFGRLVLPSLAMKWVTTATRVGEIKNMTLWRAMALIATEFTTLSNIAELYWSDETDDYAVPLLSTEERSAGDSITEWGFAINAMLCCASDHQIQIARHMNYLSTTDKASLTTVAQFTARDWTGQISISRRHVEQVGRVMLFGGSFNTSSGDTTALRAIAPAQIFSRGQGRATVNSQVLKVNLSLVEMTAEVALRAGAEYASKNLQTVLTVNQRGAYAYQQPNVFQRYNWSIAVADTLTGLSFDGNDFWYLRDITINHVNETGYTDCQTVYVLDIAGIPAQVRAELAPEDIIAPIPSLPPFAMSPFPMLDSLKFADWTDIAPEEEQPFTEEEAKDAVSPPKTPTDEPESAKPPSDDPAVKGGSVVMIGNSANVWESRNFTKSNSPVWNDITPSSGHTHGVYDPFTQGAYVIANDGVNSTFWRCTNTQAPEWQSTTLANNLFKYIRPVASAGRLYVYAPDGVYESPDEWGMDWNFAESEGGWRIRTEAQNASGAYVDDTGWRSTEIATSLGNEGLTLIKDFLNPDTVTGDITVTAYYTLTTTFNITRALGLIVNNTNADVENIANTSGTWVQTKTLNATSDALEFRMVKIGWPGTAQLTLTRITASGAGVNPFTGKTGGEESDHALTAYSTNRGAAFVDAVIVGDVLTDGGSSALRTGDVMLASADAIVRVAGAGGEYDDQDGGETAGSYPLCIWAYGKGTQAYFYASAAAVGGETLWKVDGGKTPVTPNDGSHDGLPVSANCICTAPENDNVIFALMNFGGTVKLARSTDGGSTWAFTTGMTNANYVRAKNSQQVYIAAGANVLYSEDGGVTFVAKDAPGGSLLWIEVR